MENRGVWVRRPAQRSYGTPKLKVVYGYPVGSRYQGAKIKQNPVRMTG